MKNAFLGLIATLALSAAALAVQPERWLHIKVTGDPDRDELVRVNVPLSLAEKVLPAIKSDELRAGRLTLHEAELNGVDLRAVVDAVRGAPDSEFVSVENKEETVQVMKSSGNLLIKAQGKRGKKEKVDIKVPMPIIEALVSGTGDQLDILAAIRAMEKEANAIQISVDDDHESVRIWVDTRNTSD